ncbi:DUF3043 domain-containing protein [Nocardioides sp.]|uniref:DUF3043 domain-containing protein n=1 Tax=Nocardioides sp. TaxID=35761 RepID=UPI00352978AE
MPVFRRRKPESESTEQLPPKPDGKGRPTPTRKEAEAAARARAKAAPKSRRELAMQERERRVLSRDAGPAKALVRDLVDQRIMLMEVLIPVLLVSLVASWVGQGKQIAWVIATASLIFYAVFLTMIIETVMLRLRIRREMAQRLPGQPTRGLLFYAFNRSMLMRFLRSPKPAVKVGEPLQDHYR